MKGIKKKLLSLLMSVIMIAGLGSLIPATVALAGNGLTWPVPGHTTVYGDYHQGYAFDISDGSISGADIVAAKGGTIFRKYTCTSQHANSNGDCDGFGTGLIIKGDDGRYYCYMHMQGGSIPSDIVVGSYVSQGQKIGKVGKTGNATGYHLHFQCGEGSGYSDPWKANVKLSKSSSDYDGSASYSNSYKWGDYTTSLGSDFYAYITNASTGKSITNSWGSVTASTKTDSASQIWHFVLVSDGYYKIISCYDDLALDVAKASSLAWATVQTYTYNGGSAQLWRLYSYNGKYFLKPKCSNCTLETSSSSVYDSDVQMYPRTNSSSQMFNIQKVSAAGKATLSYKESTTECNTVTFSWSGGTNASYYNLNITSVDTGYDYSYYYLDSTSQNVTLYPGKYKVSVTSINSFSYAESSESTISINAHSYSSWATSIEPTCTETGIKTRTCSRCGYVDSEEIEATGHNYSKKVVAPSCEEGGYTINTCSVCGDVYYDSETDATGHSYKTVVDKSSGTATHICSVCGDVYTSDYSENTVSASVAAKALYVKENASEAVSVKISTGDGNTTATATYKNGVITVDGVREGYYYTMTFTGTGCLPYTVSGKIQNGELAVDETVELNRYGDVNFDGAVNIKDMSLIYKHINHTSTMSQKQINSGDIYVDGVINIKDYSRLYKHINKTSLLW